MRLGAGQIAGVLGGRAMPPRGGGARTVMRNACEFSVVREAGIGFLCVCFFYFSVRPVVVQLNFYNGAHCPRHVSNSQRQIEIGTMPKVART